MIQIVDSKLCFSLRGERLVVEPWGKNAFRVRATRKNKLSDRVGALGEDVINDGVSLSFDGSVAEITNGKIKTPPLYRDEVNRGTTLIRR